MRFWISRQPGEVDGPFDIDTLNQMREAGDLPDSTQVCSEGSETWHPLAFLDTAEQETPPTSAAAAGDVVAEQGPAVLAERSYSIENAFSIGWTMVQKYYALLLGMIATMVVLKIFIGLVGALVSILTQTATTAFPVGAQNPWGVSILSSVGTPSHALDTLFEWLVFTPYTIGSAMVIVRALRGETVSWSESWCGFWKGNYGRLLLIQLCWLGILLVLLLCAGLLFGVPILIAYQYSSSFDAVPVVVLIGGVCMIAAWFFVYLRWGFSVMLVIDPKAGRPSMGEAFKGSWRMTRGGSTIGSLFVLGIMAALILVFSFACFVLPGIFLGAPYILAVIATAYALLFHTNIVAANRCLHCGYPRSSGSESICSECGRPWKQGVNTLKGTEET